MIQSLDKTCIQSYEEQVTKSKTWKYSSFLLLHFTFTALGGSLMIANYIVHHAIANAEREDSRPFIVIFARLYI